MQFAPIGLTAWNFAQRVFMLLWSVFDRLLESSGTKFYYLSTVLLVIVFRLLAAPLLGVGLQVGSDLYRSGVFRAKPYSKSGGLAPVHNYGSKSHSQGLRR